MKLPISVKGIVVENGKIWLRRNERREWELPGGKLDPGEQPDDTVAREMAEELGMRVRPVAPVHVHRHVIPGSMDESDGVLVVSYLCEILERTGVHELTGEGGAAAFGAFTRQEIDGLHVPDFYRTAIDRGLAASSGAPAGA